MALNFNSEPYYDNFDETKKFHRILFKPGYAVQARELTQLQTALQDQISKFGKHIFIEGSVVLGGERAFEDDILSIKLENTFGGSSVAISFFNDVEIVGLTSGTKAHCKLALASNATDPHTLLVKLTSGESFTLGEDVQCIVNSITYTATIQSADAFNNSMIFSINSGVFFVAGHFVYHPSQTIAVDAYSNTSSKNIGFNVNHKFVTYEEDESLLDNAQGSFNYAAPGADRYVIDLVLTSKNLDVLIPDFIEVARVADGKLVSNQVKTIYSEIGKELARRTFDESGNYTVKQWPVQIIEHVDNNPEKFTLALDPGKAYVKGYEFETISQSYIDIDRARDTAQAIDINTYTDFGNFVVINTVAGVFNPSDYTTINLRNSSNTTIGTARVRYFKHLIGTPGSNSTKYKLYLFSIAMNAGQVFRNVHNITATGASALISEDSKIGGTGDTFLSGTDKSGLVFEMPNNYIESLVDESGNVKTSYTTQRVFTNVRFNGGVSDAITVLSNEQFASGNINASYHVVITSVTSGSYTIGQVLNFTTGGRSASIGITSATFNVNDGNAGFFATIVAEINVDQQVARTKTLSGWTKGVITTNLNQTLGGKDSLRVSDVHSIASVYNIGNNTGSTVIVNGTTGNITWNGVPNTDVTSNYILDDGQTAEFYGHGSLVLTGSAPTINTDNLLVVYKNFAHGGSGFFSKESYVNVEYEDIPTFTDQATGKTYNLRDCFDFRPRVTDGGTAINFNQVSDPDEFVEASYRYYLGRMDKIIAMPNNTFSVKKGNPAVNPLVPTDSTDGMLIYILAIPPYTADLTEVGVKYLDNKRYTMRDIGKLDRRIQNLEYYTQLSLLEKQAKDTSIPDSSNFEKFKNGFAVDPFTSADIFSGSETAWASRRWSWWASWFNGSNSWNTAGSLNYNANSIAMPSNTDFKAAIDPINQELRAPFTVNFSQFDSSSLINTSKDSELISLSYTETSVISQFSATQSLNVNPFNIIKFNGKLILEPAFDQWVDTNYLPAVNTIVDVRVPDADDATVRIGTQGPGGRALWRTTSVTTTVQENVLGTSTVSLGASVVDVQFVPYIRSNTIAAISSGLRPLAEVFSFIENTNVDEYCRPLTLIEVQNHSGPLFVTNAGNHEELSFTGGASGRAAYYSSPTLTDNSKRRLAVMELTGNILVGNVVTGANGGTATVTKVTTYSLGDTLVPDEYGYLAIEIQIPAGVFKTGERTIRLIDEPNNDITLSSSSSEAKYTANGIVQNKQETLLTTRSVQRQQVTTIEGFWYDPLAQTFNIDPRAYPQGMHVSSVDVYFKTKSSTVPVTMQIRRTVNGYPSSYNDIPFAEVDLMPEFVNISADASVPTTFTFATPIYLSPNDYAITLIAQTQEYEVWIAEMGRTEVNGLRVVDKQPYNGSLFKSQNAATWTAVEEQDLKFNIKRAVFNTSGSAEFNIKDPESLLEYQTIYLNSSAITPTGTSITWEAATYENGAATIAEFIPIDINQDIDYSGIKALTAQSGLGFPSFILRANLSTDNDAVSPIIDGSALSLVTALNEINNDSTNEAGVTAGGNAIAKYISKPINLADGFEASNLCVTVDICKLFNTNVKVYYKTLASGKVTPISSENWVEMELENPVPNSTNSYDYREHRFFPVGAFDQYGIPQDAPIAARFNSYQIKIVMLSSNKAVSPKLKDLRIIALDS